MKRNDDIRRLLRDADPAENRELPPVDRARMRAAVTSSALHGRSRRSHVPLLAAGAVLAAAAIVLIALIPRDDHRTVATEAQSSSATPAIPAPVIEAPSVEPTSERVAATLPARAKPAHDRPRLAHLDDAEGTTRIEFTAPEGTKILWFVGTPTRRS